MTDKLEHQLAEGIEDTLAMPRPPTRTFSTVVSTGTIESKLVSIEKQIAEVRALLAQIRSIL